MEKIKPQARFDGEQKRRREPPTWVCVPSERRKTCQSGTGKDGSNWDGPRLTSEFATQVLGQALGANTPTASPRTAYKRPALVLLPLLDKKV